MCIHIHKNSSLHYLKSQNLLISFNISKNVLLVPLLRMKSDKFSLREDRTYHEVVLTVLFWRTIWETQSRWFKICFWQMQFLLWQVQMLHLFRMLSLKYNFILCPLVQNTFLDKISFEKKKCMAWYPNAIQGKWQENVEFKWCHSDKV